MCADEPITPQHPRIVSQSFFSCKCIINIEFDDLRFFCVRNSEVLLTEFQFCSVYNVTEKNWWNQCRHISVTIATKSSFDV